MSGLLDALFGALGEEGQRVYGVVTGVVTNNKDPDKLGRVKVKFPWLSDADESFWAPIAVPMAGGGRGTFFLPEVNDEVLLAFDHGDPRFPYVLGALWSARDKPPVAIDDDGKNDIRLIKSRNGHVVRFDDKQGEGKIEIVDAGGKSKLVFDTKAQTITITSEKDLELAAPDGKLTLRAKEIEVRSDGKLTVQAKGALKLTSSSTTTLKGSTVNIN